MLDFDNSLSSIAATEDIFLIERNAKMLQDFQIFCYSDVIWGEWCNMGQP